MWFDKKQIFVIIQCNFILNRYQYKILNRLTISTDNNIGKIKGIFLLSIKNDVIIPKNPINIKTKDKLILYRNGETNKITR